MSHQLPSGKKNRETIEIVAPHPWWKINGRIVSRYQSAFVFVLVLGCQPGKCLSSLEVFKNHAVTHTHNSMIIGFSRGGW